MKRGAPWYCKIVIYAMLAEGRISMAFTGACMWLLARWMPQAKVEAK